MSEKELIRCLYVSLSMTDLAIHVLEDVVPSESSKTHLQKLQEANAIILSEAQEYLEKP